MTQTDTAQFKDQLYSTFKQTGVINKLKSTLRKTLLDKLQIQPPPSPKQSPPSPLPLILSKKLLTCLISQYLLKNSQQYTVSILLPQTNLSKSQLLHHQQLLQVLGITPSQYIGLKEIKHHYSVLDVLVYMGSCEFGRKMVQRGVGTNQDFEEPLGRKLEMLERGYLKEIERERLGRVEGLQEILQKQRKSITQMMSSRFQVEKRMLRTEIQAKVRREESDRWSGLALMSKKQQDIQYEKKLLELKSREKDVLDRLEKKRKQVQTEISKLRAKELEMIKKYEMKEKELDVEWRTRIRDVEVKEKELQRQELTIRAKKKEYEDCIRMVRQKIITDEHS